MWGRRGPSFRQAGSLIAVTVGPHSDSLRSVIRLAWTSLIMTVITVVSGDIVQATESGAGCGESWPRCDGAILPGVEDAATVIEFTHRLLTVALTVVVVALFVASRRALGRGHRTRAAAAWVAVFLALEVVIGALLVAFGWVEDDASVGRVVADGLHVVNTFFLLGAVALTIYYASGGRAISSVRDDLLGRRFLIGAGVIVLVAISGAVNSLADTLFPADSVLDGLRDEFGATAPFLVRMRVAHPVIAIAGGIAIYLLVRSLPPGGEVSTRLASAVSTTIGAQFLMGALNVAFLTPLETQVIHLLLADLLWLLFAFLAFRRLESIEPGVSTGVSAQGGAT